MAKADREKVATFRDLHGPGKLLLLPNCWDAGSARLIQECGAAATATTSAGLAWAHGYPDGGVLPVPVLAATVAEIVRVLRIPLSVDMEAGFSDDPSQVAEAVSAVIDAGGVGMNLEDASDSPDLMCAKIEAVRRVAARAGVDFFINARTDVYLRGLVPTERALEVSIERARRYRDAGCDGIFVPRMPAGEESRAVADAIAPLPLNLLAAPNLPGASELGALGVRRVSAGSALSSAALGVIRKLTTEFLSRGDASVLFGQGLEYGAMNNMLARAT